MYILGNKYILIVNMFIFGTNMYI